jgi:hypothetical protein
MSILDKSTPTQLQSGLRKDMNLQQQGDVTFALNGIRDAHDGGKYDYQSEPGNELVESLPTGYSFVGSINGKNNEVYIFATATASTLGTIGIFKEGKYTEKVRTNFGWNPQHPITGEFHVRNGCEDVIYWCNGDTWDGYYNFDRPELFQDGSGNWVPNKFKLVPDVTVPKIDLKSVNDSGGFLPLGSYCFQVELLDKTLNSIYKTDLSPQTVIYDDSFGEVYNHIDGGLNVAQYTEDIGGVPITNKSITLTLSNLDTQFAYLRLNVARQITGVQTVDAHAVGQLIPISGSSIDFTYTGYDVGAGDYPLDYSEMITDNIRYDTAYVMEQVQGRLLRAGLKQGIRDYSNYQFHASQVGVKWVAKEVLANDVTSLGDPKNPQTYWSCTSFQGDEVYAIGIRFLHLDGTWSPMFHIPGREAVSTDTQLLTVSASMLSIPGQVYIGDVDHLGLNIGDTVEKWKVFNTASVLTANTGAHPYDYSGKMGYYEAETTYPDIRDCDNNLIWGVDNKGTTITTSDKIRHHRFPDRRLVSHHAVDGNDNYIVPFGIKFDTITYPNADVVGHQFCYVKRTETNKTVLDSGWFSKQYDNANMLVGSSTPIVGMALQPIESSVSATLGGAMLYGTFGRYSSANVFYNKHLFNNDYIKFNNVYRFDLIESAPHASFNIAGGGTIDAGYSELIKTDEAGLQRQNYKIVSQIYVNPKSVTLTNYPINIVSGDFASADNVIEVKRELENVDGVIGATPVGFVDNSYVYKKATIRPYGNLFNLNYNYINFNHMDSIALNDNIFYNGDCLIMMSNTMRVSEQINYFMDGVAHNRYEEQQINVALRYGGTAEANDYYKIDGDYDWLLFKMATLNSNGEYEIRPLNQRYPEYYAYNKDYNKQSIEYAKSVLPITYNYCSDCLGTFDNKIVWSPKSFDEESFDLYRINKVNDSITIPAHRGRITGLKYQNNLLLVHTENSSFILQPNPQALATDVNSVYLTTGGFLSLPPSEITQNDIGYAGCQSKQHMCETPAGHAWCDQKRGQIFLFDTKINELTNEQSGMSQWFKEELPSYMQKDFYQTLEMNYPNDSTYDVTYNGIGIIMYYDPRFKRLLISKKDYKPINFKAEGAGIGDTYYNESTNEWKYVATNGLASTTYFSNTSAFENKSWTISYSFDTQGFTSWHSYRPVAAFFDDSNFYTMALSELLVKNIWRHKHVSSFQKFYNVKYFFIIEWMTTDSSTDNFDSLHYTGYALEWDATNKKWKAANSTFQYGLVYNSDQSSNVFTLALANQETSPYGNIGFSNLNKFVIKTDNNYKISGIYDLTIANPPVTSDWTFLKTWPGYIDQLSLASNHDMTKSAYNMTKIKDKYVYCRLFYNPSEDYKKVINLLQTNESRSIR